MSKPRGDDPNAVARRRRAEEQVAQLESAKGAMPSPEQARALLHELQVHQIELELQNEELRVARAELEESLERYHELYDFAPVAYCTLGLDGTILQVNLCGARLLGAERALLVDRRLGVFVHKDHVHLLNDLLAQASQTDELVSAELALALPSDAANPSPCVMLSVQYTAQKAEYRTIITDLTERKRAEERLLAANKMEAVGRLAGGVAHDFNNLLTVMLGYASFAIESMPEGSEIRDDLVELQGAARRAEALTKQLLAFSRNEPAHPELADANHLVRALTKMLRRVLGQHIELVVTLADQPCHVCMGPGLLEQVVMNLLINARDALPRGGTVTISTESLAPADPGAPRLPDGSVAGTRLTVRDNGVGIDKNTMARMFEPFFTTKGRGSGTGFGLSTVYGIVHQCGGQVLVQSELGQGATFEVLLPRPETVSPSQAPGPNAYPGGRAGGSETILLVDDERALLVLAKRVLTAAGYRVLPAGSGEEALHLFGEHLGAVHLLLSDVMMPKMTGIVLAERIRALEPNIKVLHMSGYPDTALVGHAPLDATRYLSKPFTPSALCAKVREVLDA